jgi:sulfur transfer complex TusBCD TusB component (DsrH family)
MKKLYISYCTEYEKGWGSKPDGIMLAIDHNKMLTEIEKQHKKGDYEIYWRYTDPIEVYTDDENYDKLILQLNENEVLHSMNVSSLNLYKKI